MQGRAAAMDSTGNIYAIGSIGTNIKILKYNSTGNIIWQRMDSLNADGMGICAAADKNGNIYFTAEDLSLRIATLKYDSSGNRKWLKYYSAGSESRTNAMAIDYAGNIFITGYGFLTYRYNYLTIKYNPQGDTLWTAIYNSPSTNGGSSANAICIDLQNNVYVTGNSIISTRPEGDYLSIKYNSNGIQQWVARYEGATHLGGTGESIIVDKFGYCYVSGITEYDFNKLIIGTIKYASNGDSVWVRLYFPPIYHIYESGLNLLLDSSLNVYVSGRGSDTNHVGGCLRMIKYDKFGNLLWTTFDTCASILYSSVLDKYLNIYSTGATGYRFYNCEYNSSGNKIWSSYYPQNNPPFGSWTGFKLFLDNYNNLYIFGSSLDSSLLIKYAVLTNINQTSENIVESFKLYQNFPNPFNPTTKIKFDIPALGSPLGSRSSFLNPINRVGAGGMCVLKVYDILGKEIETLVNEKLNPGTYEVTFNASQYPSGVYFYTLISGEYRETKKMLMIK